MSKDQLSWEQLLNQATADASKDAAPEVVPMAMPETLPETLPETSPETLPETVREALPAEITPKEKPKRPRKSTVKEKTPVLDSEPTAYAKKDWSSLVKKTESTGELVVQKEASVTRAAPPVVAAEPPPPKAEVSREPQIISVSQLNKHIRDMLEGRFPMLWLKGEISNFKAHTSGHFYFSLKDSKAQISAVMFRGFNTSLRFRPEDGMEVLVRGKITVYEPRGNYQIFCESMEPVGAGALQKAYEQLKAKLQREGLFEESRKRALPTLPKHIAIVTSPTGAAIRDMLNVLGRRFKGAEITVIPCKVQGDQAPREIIEAIRMANLLQDVDVMIVGRGGGSIEDLWAFNDEGVARAIAGARVPVISAVGHEVDFTIADFVADLRAPTPSAAAELVVKSAADLLERVRSQSRSLKLAMLSLLNQAKQTNHSLSRRLIDPQRRIQDAAIRCDELLQRLQNAVGRGLEKRRLEIKLLDRKMGTPLLRIARDRGEITSLDRHLQSGMRNLLLRKRQTLSRQMAVLDSLSPLKVLDRGYSMVVSDGKVVTDAERLSVGQEITVRMSSGSVDAKITKKETQR